MGSLMRSARSMHQVNDATVRFEMGVRQRPSIAPEERPGYNNRCLHRGLQAASERHWSRVRPMPIRWSLETFWGSSGAIIMAPAAGLAGAVRATELCGSKVSSQSVGNRVPLAWACGEGGPFLTQTNHDQFLPPGPREKGRAESDPWLGFRPSAFDFLSVFGPRSSALDYVTGRVTACYGSCCGFNAQTPSTLTITFQVYGQNDPWL